MSAVLLVHGSVRRESTTTTTAPINNGEQSRSLSIVLTSQLWSIRSTQSRTRCIIVDRPRADAVVIQLQGYFAFKSRNNGRLVFTGPYLRPHHDSFSSTKLNLSALQLAALPPLSIPSSDPFLARAQTLYLTAAHKRLQSTLRATEAAVKVCQFTQCSALCNCLIILRLVSGDVRPCIRGARRSRGGDP